MKPPSREVYWSHVGSFLLLKDMALFEVAVDYHALRQNLGLPMPTPMSFVNPMAGAPISRNPSTASHASRMLKNSPATAYSDYCNFAKDSLSLTFVISSEEKLNWILKRGIYPTDVTLEYVPLMREESGFIHLFTNVKILQLKCPTASVGWIFHLVKSLEKFDAHDNKFVDDAFIQGMVNQCQINGSRLFETSPGPHVLDSLSMNYDKLSVKMVEHMFVSLPYVKSLLMNEGSTPLFRHHVELVTKHLKNLTSLEIWNSSINDVGLEVIKRSELKLERIKLFRCPNITNVGLSNMISPTSDILDLTIENMNITQHVLIPILSQCPNLSKLTLWNNTNRYTDALLKGIAKHCPHMKKLKIYSDSKGDNYTVDGIRDLVYGCSAVEELALSSENLSTTCFELLALVYGRSLKKLAVPEKVAGDFIATVFEGCSVRILKN